MGKYGKYLLLLMLLLFCITGCSKKDQNEKNTKPVLNIWTFTDELIKPSKIFEKKYNCKINLTIIPGNDYLVKTTAPLANGVGTPDIFTVECSFVKSYTDEGFYQNLSETPFNADELKDQYTPYVYKLGCDKKGNVVGLSNQMTPGGLFYRRSIAKKVFGTDDPKVIGKHFSSMKKLFESAQMLKDKGYKLVPGWKDLYNLINPKQLPWVDKDNNLILPKSKLEFLAQAKQLRDNGFSLSVSDWTPPWFAAMCGPVKDNETGKPVEVFGYVLAPWGLWYLLKSASPGVDEDGKPLKNPTAGDWAVTSGPCPFFAGGTWIGIYHGSKMKKLAWEFIKFFAYKSEYLEDFYEHSGDTPSLAYLQKKFEKTCSDPFLGGQNYMKFFMQQSKNIDPDRITKYDQDIDFFFKAAIDDYVNGIVSKEEAIQAFKANVKSAFYEINVGGSNEK